ncbi:uncharacterized protein LOC130758381 [Actinidia eriantha]|uniref:uncharacterized protein LOC130758381 n=1 Tax=Actinidia eriantha TaxID=165200 RepID=UPI002590612E|nr:uncharacterized protein LOC130758381 [Actinidia eriantha]
MEGIEIENKHEALKSPIAIRCAKAALLISSLKCSANRLLDSTNNSEHKEREMELRREAEDLRRKLVRERVKIQRMKLCSVMELLLHMAILLSLWILCLMLALNFI